MLFNKVSFFFFFDGAGFCTAERSFLAGSGAYCPVEVHGLHRGGFSRGAWALGRRASAAAVLGLVAAAPGLESTGS